MRPLLLITLTAAACGGGGTKTLELTLTMPDGTVTKKTLGGDTGFLFDGQQRATASFPDIATWNKDVPLGLSMRVAPLQPGRYGTGGNLHLGADTVASAKSLTLDLSVERVRWQNEGAYPFRVEGTFTGTSTENHKLEGRFSTTTHDCSDKVAANAGSFLCGLPYGTKKQSEQVWTIDSWVTEGECPDAIFKRYAGGMTYTVNPREASAGGQKSLQCVTTYANGFKSICGASEEGFQADGCTWAITAYSTPGIASVGPPRMAIFAGTTSSCAPKLCTMYPRAFVHKSGATAQD
ncbi:MAG: hypothetical protein Q8S33_34565 [Myxococcales bacterium]|nr:hypothetical protein [Myxococcales bacterium]MDP3505516.1 hypothetical protein [Myxococcales bacterium]